METNGKRESFSKEIEDLRKSQMEILEPKSRSSQNKIFTGQNGDDRRVTLKIVNINYAI